VYIKLETFVRIFLKRSFSQTKLSLMKNRLLILFVILSHLAFGQDTLSLEDIKSNYYKFTINDGKIEGKGAQFLLEEFSNSHVVMLGEYHEQKSISDFTKTIIPILNKNGYKHFGIEVGPTMGEYLNTLSSPTVVSEIKKVNKHYQIVDGEDTCTPIPFFSNIEDAQFLDEAKKHQWNIFGVDQEFYDSYPFLFDIMFDNLNSNGKKTHTSLHQSAKDSIDAFYLKEMNEGLSYVTLINESPMISDFLKAMKEEKANLPIVEAFNKSIAIYKMNDDNKWYDNYQARITYMKRLLRQEFEAEQYDITRDKLLIKMGRLHLSKGTSPYAFSELGNTLDELAAFDGVNALGIGFETRYYIENDSIVDQLDSDNKRIQNYKGFKQFGDKYEWVILDLRPMRKDFHWHPHPLKGKLNTYLLKLISNYDILIIPPAYGDGTPNY